MTYKVPYITAKMIFTMYPVSFRTASHIMTSQFSENASFILRFFTLILDCRVILPKALVLSIGRVLWEELLVLSRFHS